MEMLAACRSSCEDVAWMARLDGDLEDLYADIRVIDGFATSDAVLIVYVHCVLVCNRCTRMAACTCRFINPCVDA
jgi:hypothetical protein